MASGEVIFCDTSFVSVTFGAHPDDLVSAWPGAVRSRLDKATLAITPFVIAEVRMGLAFNPQIGTAKRAAIERDLSRYVVVPASPAAIDEWARIAAALKRAGHNKPSHNDVWMAAIAAVHKTPIVSCDGDFGLMPGVDAIDLPLVRARRRSRKRGAP